MNAKSNTQNVEQLTKKVSHERLLKTLLSGTGQISAIEGIDFYVTKGTPCMELKRDITAMVARLGLSHFSVTVRQYDIYDVVFVNLCEVE